MNKKLLSICMYVFIVINIFPIGIVNAYGNTIYVDGDNINGPWDGTIEHPFQYIQDGIDDAENNDTIFVFDGIYYETINVTKSIRLLGENRENTIIDGKNNNNWWKIITIHVSYVKIENFTIINASSELSYSKGIYTNSSLHFKNIFIANCIITHNNFNIVLWNVTDCSILNCILSNSNYNIEICENSHNITIFNCSLENGDMVGLWLVGDATSLGQISNASISYCNINQSCYGIKIDDAKNVIIKNNTIHDNKFGIYLDVPSSPLRTENITIFNNTINDNKLNGIFCSGDNNVSNITIYNNNISNNAEESTGEKSAYGEGGIVFYDSNDNITIKNNTIDSNFNFGIYLGSSENIQIINNNVLNSKSVEGAFGIGIFLQRSSFNNITSNTIAYNQNIGINIEGHTSSGSSKNNTICRNSIINNDRYGMLFYSNTMNNSFYHNNIINNTIANAYDSCENLCDNGYPSGGNFWDDYTGQDSNQDGIGDTSYLFDEDQEDRYPLMSPIYHPTLNFPPIKPHKPDGPILIEKNVNYLFSTSTIDVNDDQVYYKWGWGDGTYSDWIGPANSGSTYGTYHQWSQVGSYNIKVKAKDILGEESIWSDTKPLVVELASDFSVIPSVYGQPYQMIYFYDQSMNYFDIVSYQWDFGDSSFSYNQNTSHSFIDNTVYDVSLTVIDNKSNTNTSHQRIYIDSIPPIIDSITNNPDMCGFGYNISISANATDNLSGIKFLKVNISFPDYAYGNYSMINTDGNTYQYIFNSTWQIGQYNYTIWAIDNSNNSASNSSHHFNVSANAVISIATLKNSYSGTQYINITDPPNPPENLTLVDRGLTWDTYYNASSGENILETFQGPVNYQEDNETWTPINKSFYPLASNHPAYVYGYRNGNDHGLYGVYFKSNAQNEWPVAFNYNKSDDPTIHAVRSKLVGVGYVDPQSNWGVQISSECAEQPGTDQ